VATWPAASRRKRAGRRGYSEGVTLPGPSKTIVVEPLEEPRPVERPAPEEAPAAPEPEPEKVPA
jgi:hypothetical protein